MRRKRKVRQPSPDGFALGSTQVQVHSLKRSKADDVNDDHGIDSEHLKRLYADESDFRFFLGRKRFSPRLNHCQTSRQMPSLGGR